VLGGFVQHSTLCNENFVPVGELLHELSLLNLVERLSIEEQGK